MLLSPLASPSRYRASLCLPFPPLAHGICEDDDEDEFDDSNSSDDSASENDSEESASTASCTSDDTSCDDVDVDNVDVDSVHVDGIEGTDDAERGTDQEPEPLALPVELIFTVVELAASHRRTAVSLCRVSSWVRAVVLPILYGTLLLQGSGPSPFDVEDAGAVADSIVISGETKALESPLRHVRSLWLDVPADRAPLSLDACPRLKQLALPLEAHATICNTQRWLAPSTPAHESEPTAKPNALELDFDLTSAGSGKTMQATITPCHSFTVLGQSHPHRWAPLTISPNGRAFLRGVTHLRILNLCLSHYIPLEYTPNLTHLCIPFFDLRISPSSLTSSPIDMLSDASSLTGSAATSSFTGLDYILTHPSLQMVVLTLNPRYWRFDELSLKGWAVRAMARDPRLYVVAETRDDATRDWEVPKRDWEDEARGGASVWEKAVCVRRKFLTRLSRTWEAYVS